MVEKKGGIKSLQKLDLQVGIPVKIYHSHAKEHDSLFIQHEGIVSKNEIAVFDKAYNNYELFDRWNKEDIYFVTRLKNNAKERFIKEYELQESTTDEVLRDAEIVLFYTDKEGVKRKVTLRLVSYYDPQIDKTFYFLTNLF